MTNETQGDVPGEFTPTRRESKLGFTKKTTVIAAIAVVAALALGGVVGWESAARIGNAAAAEKKLESDKVAAELKETAAKLEKVQSSLKSSIAELQPQKDVKARELAVTAAETAVTAAEEDVASREKDVTGRETRIEARETAVTTRETNVKAAEDATEWWITGVQECLGRQGSYKMASVSAGSLGRNVSCITG